MGVHRIHNNKSVTVNNDGCICAACGIAKKLGVGKKFLPYFQVKKEVTTQQV
jgi:DNA polymerase V